MSIIGPLWDVGQVSQEIVIFEPPFAGAASRALVAFLWQMISGLAYAFGATNPLSRTFGVFHPTMIGWGFMYW
jgi:hypothetical protein